MDKYFRLSRRRSFKIDKLHKIDKKAYGFNRGMSVSLNTLLNCYIERVA